MYNFRLKILAYSYSHAPISQNTDNGVLSKHRDPANALAKLTLHKFTAATSMESNGAMEVTAEMEKCLLDDTRPEKKGKISRYMCTSSLCVLILFVQPRVFRIVVCIRTHSGSLREYYQNLMSMKTHLHLLSRNP